jgi:uncharacterized protein (DUF1810 family)
MKKKDLLRFLDAHNQAYLGALSEIRNGRKETHWMWFIFPQLYGLGKSDTAKFYALSDLQQAMEFLNHPVLGKHLLEISTELLKIEDRTALEIFGYPDDLKLHSSMTLFAQTGKDYPVFSEVIRRYFGGIEDSKTIQLLNQLLK